MLKLRDDLWQPHLEWGDKTPGPPVLYARASGVVTAKAIAGMAYNAVDWYFKSMPPITLRRHGKSGGA